MVVRVRTIESMVVVWVESERGGRNMERRLGSAQVRHAVRHATKRDESANAGPVWDPPCVAPSSCCLRY